MSIATFASSNALAQGLVSHRAGRLVEAEQLYRRALKKDPRNAQVLALLGGVCMSLGKPQEAVTLLKRAVTADAHFAPAYEGLTSALLAVGNATDAVTAAGKLVRLQPDAAAAWVRLATALLANGDAAGAEERASRALALAPDHVTALVLRGDARKARGAFAEAAADYTRLLELSPSHEVRYNLAGLLAKAGQVDLAIELYRTVLEAKPDSPDVHQNLGVAYYLSHRLADAIECNRKALELAPDNPTAMCNLARAHRDLGQVDAAIPLLDRALSLDPDHVEAHVARAFTRLSSGDFERGWPELEWRWRTMVAPALQRPKWGGEDLRGKTILLHGEQGLGDVLQFVRYAEIVQRLGCRTILHCPPRLIDLLAHCRGIDELVPIGGDLPAYDVWAGLQSLPGLLGTTLASVPSETPYLQPDPALVERWRADLSQVDGLRVGINWCGQATSPLERWRRMPLSAFSRLAEVPGVTLINLHREDGAEGALGVDFPVLNLAPRLDRGSSAFLDTAAAMKSLDLVITSDTAIAHLAGALGVSVWVGLSFAPEWRWMREGERSPWYPTMRLFRQVAFDEWTHVLEGMALELRERAKCAVP